MTIIVIPIIPLAALVGDRWLPRRTWIALSLFLLALVAWPLDRWMLATGGSLVSVVVEMFPSRNRLSGYSVAFSVGVGIVGGLTL